MKKVGYLLFASALVALGGCSDDTFEQTGGTPAKVGDEITFGSSLNDANVNVRTVYDDTPTVGPDGTSYYRVSWEQDGSDQIAIYCPQASNGTLVNYSVTPDANNSTHSSLVTKVNSEEPGLQWGSANEHHFYGFYPASAVTGTEDGHIEGFVSATQNVERWNAQSNDNGGTTYYGVSNTDNAYMWAYGAFNKEKMGNQDVPLTFHPWMTILEIHIPGPESGEMKVTNVNVRAIEGTQTVLTGRFVCDMSPVETDPNAVPRYEAVTEGQPTSRNTISISGWDEDQQNFITLGPNDEMVVRAYLLPVDDDATDARNLQVRVQPMNGAVLTRTLGYSETNKEGSVQSHKVNIVKLPSIQNNGRNNYWMSSIDPNVYLSELSIPGSKFSYLYGSNAGSNAAFQGVDIPTQFKDGVRAFIVQLGANVNYDGWSYGVDNVKSATMPIYCGGGDNLEDALREIAQALSSADEEMPGNHECAVVMLTFEGNSVTSNRPLTLNNAEHVWMDALQYKLQQLAEDPDLRIYTDEVTANTTLADVAGKIVIKVNTNSDAQAGYIAANASVPALFSRWDGAINTVDLRWGTPNTASTRPLLHWMYQEATHVGEGTEITAANKIGYAEQVFENSITAYEQNDAHDTWYMNDCGGTFHGNVSGAGNFDGSYGNGDTNDNAPISLARWLNPQITAYLQQRDENATLGLVFFNFADKQHDSGMQYGTDNLIQTIIDNNFKFNLRIKGSGSTSQTGSDASYAPGGNVWQ